MDDENTAASADGLYRLEVEDLAQVRAPVLVHALRGSLDAGSVGELVAGHLLDSLPVRRVATFVADELIDYRSRRPAMEVENFRFSAYHEPMIALDLLQDDEGSPLLLLHGSEPDLRWEAFVDDVVELVEQLGVERTVGVHGFPAPVPHTRPTQVQSHGDALPELGERRGIMLGTVQLPGSASGLLEFRLQGEGHTASGLSVSVPHYLAQNEYPAAAAEAVRWISRAGGLALPVGELEAAAAEMAAQIAEQVDQSPEIAGMVGQLEAQFDQFAQVSGARVVADHSLPPAVPSADEIGAEAEAFLAKQTGPAGEEEAHAGLGDEPAPARDSRGGAETDGVDVADEARDAGIEAARARDARTPSDVENPEDADDADSAEGAGTTPAAGSARDAQSISEALRRLLRRPRGE